MAQKTWELSGEYMESCNCDYLCPCIFTNPQAPATHEHCTALMVYRIDRGHHGDVSPRRPEIRAGHPLQARSWRTATGCSPASSTKRPTTPSAQALAGIASGKAGGPPQMIRDNLVSDFRGVEFQPDRLHRRRPAPRDRDPGRPGLRDRGRGLAQPLRRALLYRQHRPSGQPPARPGARRARPRCRASGSPSACWARATTGTSRLLPGRPDRFR